MKERVKEAISLLRETYQEWNEDKAPRLAASLSYFTVFSIAPLLIVVIAIVGFVFGQEAAQGQLTSQIEGLVGPDAAVTIQELIANSSRPADNLLATIIGIVTLILGAGGVFGQLQDALNTVWDVPPKESGGILGIVQDRFLSFSMVLGVGFLLMVSLVVSAVISAVGNFAVGMVPGTEALLQVVNTVISFAIITLLFAMIYKFLPDREIEWRDVWVGAAMTSLLFTIGKFAIGLYLGNSSIGSTYGAAGSLAVILVWVFYSSQILFFGAEFTQVYARRHGSLRPENMIALAGTGAPMPSLQTTVPIEDAPSPAVVAAAATPPLPLLWMTATAVVGFLGGFLATRRDK